MQPPLSILHLSDIHRTPDEPVGKEEVYQWLVADIDRHGEEGIPSPDLIIISGDLTQSAEEKEYDDTLWVLQKLKSHLGLGDGRIVVVPGNHDIHWPTCEDYVRSRRKLRNATEESFSYRYGEHWLTYEDEESYQARLSNFRSFYRDLTGGDYPVACGAHTTHILPDMNLVIVGFSSVETVDHNRFRPEISPEAIVNAGESIRGSIGTKIAVWHHDLKWQGGTGEDYLSEENLRLLSTAGFDIGLCGHTHRPARSNVTRIEGYDMPVVSAGSLCAGSRQRPESIPRSYNIVEVHTDRFKVWVRAKRTKGTPWQDFAEFGTPQNRCSWYEIVRDACVKPDSLPLRRPGSLRPSNPFRRVNAKSAQRSEVLGDYVWTRVADDVQIDLPQIIVGARGSGKTALLYTLSIDGQLEKLRGEECIPAVGLYVPMKIDDVTAFNGKGALSVDERKALFKAAIACMWSSELIECLHRYNEWRTLQGLPALEEGGLARALSSAWELTPVSADLRALRQHIRSLRNSVLTCLSSITTPRFAPLQQKIQSQPLLRGGLGPLEDAARELRQWHVLRDTRWCVLFDEVEFLNRWQQDCVYEHVSNPSPSTSCKVATLPYAHSRALSDFPAVLVLGEDYTEVSVVMAEETEFEKVAKGLWRARVGPEAPSLEEVWPQEEYEIVLSRYAGSAVDSRWLDERLLSDLAVKSQNKARQLLAEDPRAFSDQYRRKFKEPFRFRLARQISRRGRSVPLYWGWRQMLKACGNNPRQFLRLAEMCWVMFWNGDSIRRLTAEEQFSALSRWAKAFAERCASLPHKGNELREVIDNIVDKLGVKLYGSPSLRNEQLSVKILDCSQDQAEAIAIGIAYGFLVPKLGVTETGRPMFPSTDIAMRLGYPVAVANELPLRQGEVLKIDSMRQLELSWWNE